MPYLKNKFEPRKINRIVFTLILVTALIIAGFSLGGIYTGGKNIIINEVMASNRSTIEDMDGDYPDWFEIYNPGDKSVRLDGYWVSNDRENPFMWPLPDIVIEPDQYLLVFASGKDIIAGDNGEIHTNFRISASGSELYLIDPDASVLDSVTIPDMLSNVSYGRAADDKRTWNYFLDATPGEVNNAVPYEQVTDMPYVDDSFLVINEILTDNRTSLPDEDGDLSDWIEIYNRGNSTLNLEGYWLSDKIDNQFKWRFPAVSLEPGEYLVVFASGKNRRDPKNTYLHTNYSLNDRDDTLVLSMPDGTILDVLEIGNMERDVAYGRDPDNPERWLYFPRPTPGEVNYTVGFEQFSGSPVPDLYFSEIMAVNLSTLADEDGDFEDWIEIFNPEDYAVNLDGYGLSDREENPYRWKFPRVTIEPGGRLVLFASGKDRTDPDRGELHTNFKIRATGETLVLYHPSGIMIDKIATGMLSPDLSVGRISDQPDQRFFFTNPQPGAVNDNNYFSAYSKQPLVTPVGGFYDKPVIVEITSYSDDAQIRYTLDGSDPDTSSEIYREPLLLENTAVLRARVFEEGKLPSPAENRTYFIGKNHNLTVVSVMINPDDLWDPVNGIYVKGYGASERFPYYGANFWKDMEKPIHFELYEPDGLLGLSFDAGIKIGGQFSRGMDQKIFNVFARNIYGYNEINYPLFPGKELTSFKALTLRTSGQDSPFSKIRDIMMTSLLEDTELDYQDHRQAVLYLNGEYWGIYNIRERANRYFVAGNNQLDPDKIDLLQANWIVRAGSNEHYLEMLDFVRNNNMAVEDNYNYIKTQMDVTNYIDALIAQIYFAQTDQGNIRYWREQSPDGKWRWIVYDLDWGFWPGHLNNNTLASMTNPAGTGAWNNISTTLTVKLLDNDHFRNEFISRFAYHLNHTFEPGLVIGQIDQLAANIEDEMPNQIERWGGSMDRWYREIDSMREFARKRPAVVIEHIKQKFKLSEEDMQILMQ
ncbi:MAG: lamin tail domain-containing protein [Dethiobacteria bacterium]